SQQRAKPLSYIPLIRKKQVTIAKPSDKSDSTIHRHVVTVKSQKTNVPVPPSTGVNSCPNASRSQPKSHVKLNRISPAKGVNKLPVKDQPRTNKSHLRTSNRVDSSSHLKRTTLPRTPQQNGVVERRNRTLVEAARTMLIFSKAPMFLWAEAVATACYTQNQLEILFQLIFDEYLEPPRAERPVPPAQAEPTLVSSAATPLSNTIDQDAPTLSISPSSSALQPHSLHQGVAAEPNSIEDCTDAPVDNPSFVNVFALEPHSEALSSRDISSTESPYVSQTLHHHNKWSKDHLLDNVIGNPSRPVSTQKQLATDALWCLYTLVLSKVEPKNFKSAITEDCWFQAMQDEIHEVDQLQAEAIATACYTQNRSLIHTHHNKTPYELVHNKKPDLTFLCVFGTLCYPTNNREDLGPAPTFSMPEQISSGIVPSLVPAAPYVPPTNKELEILFKPMFDEYLEPHVKRPVSLALAVPVPINSAGIAAESTLMDENPFAPIDNDPFINIFAPKPTSEAYHPGC
nr:putative ribonuclease H-like domain-containing protein [Tanacetum cinerariifolium]